MTTAYSSISIVDFLSKPSIEILKDIMFNQMATEEEKMAWRGEIDVLKNALNGFKHGHLIFEYSIPRFRKRIDVVLLYSGIIFVIEFKVNKESFVALDMEQCMDYALDLKNFHEQSHDCYIVPILIPTNVDSSKIYDNEENYKIFDDKIFDVISSTPDNLRNIIKQIETQHPILNPIDPHIWMDSLYYPTPTIIEAAQELYSKHTVKEIGNPEDNQKLKSLTKKLNNIIRQSKDKKQKSICFVTGIPGSGKTLAGLNLVSDRHNLDSKDQTVFMSGNISLVKVLQRALVLDHHKREKISIQDAERMVKSFIQHMHNYRDEALNNKDSPLAEKIIIFDEAQRAWTKDKLLKDVKKRNYIVDKSEPGFIMESLDRHPDWAVLICLIGNGQEINDGEVGISEWFSSIRKYFQHWHVYLSETITNMQQMKNLTLAEHLEGSEYHTDNSLHLDKSLRSFRNPLVAKFINNLIDEDKFDDENINQSVIEDLGAYHIRLTRDIEKAKKWIKTKARGTERYGIITHHKSYRLRPYGICIDPKLDVAKWYLDKSNSIYSSYYMEQVASEFQTQGLEIDWACVCWDANLRYDEGWKYNEFRGIKWTKINDDLKATYLKNSYRVLLTRARQGMVIFIPRGDINDDTRNPYDYDGVYNYLKSKGIKDVET